MNHTYISNSPFFAPPSTQLSTSDLEDEVLHEYFSRSSHRHMPKGVHLLVMLWQFFQSLHFLSNEIDLLHIGLLLVSKLGYLGVYI
jgi:hypothetical protein